MRQRIDLEEVWGVARRVVQPHLELRGRAIAASVPEGCPFTLDELLALDFDLRGALARLGGSLPV